uniref:Phospholipase D3-like n=1 Tax=Pundamilia nyererei TaxID=303518 RepID=A0A3B4EQK8_9CICH
DEKSLKKDLEEKEDMNRKGGKPVSRIPTFQKRPAGASQSTELPVPRKDTPVHAQPPEKLGSLETSKSKPPGPRETALPAPLFHTPKIGFEAPSTFKQVKSKTSETTPDGPTTHLPRESFPSKIPWEEPAETYDPAVKDRILLTPSGDSEKSAEIFQAPEDSQVEAIMDEEPPWETEPLNTAGLRDSISSSEAESEDELAGERSEEVKEDHKPLISQSKFPKLEEKKADPDSDAAAAPKTPAVKATKSAMVSYVTRSGCPSFTLFCFLSTTLLLLGGFSHHVWHYGLPMSVSQLTAQLELHWLEGFGLLPEPCSTDCRVHLVESIPVGLYQSSPSSRKSIADSWLHLLDRANSSVHIAAFYFTLRDSDLGSHESSDSQGRKVFEQLMKLESKGVKLQIAVNAPQQSNHDTADLAGTGAEVREVDLKAITGGIVHTKLWVVDQKHFYVGSANMDWRSLSQVKEVGLSVEDCSCLAQDAFRIFGVYWSIGGVINGSLPPYWPARLSALSSSQKPLHLKFNGVPAQVYLSSAPPQISARGRSDDLSTILSVINDAQGFVYISVMDFLPLSQFTEPLRFWPAIDTALRAAACTRGVRVQLLVSCWEHSSPDMFIFLQSLQVLRRHPLTCDIDVKIFTVPSTAEQKKIPFARVNHAKYMVTDRVVYIGTSNWSENYFAFTAGVGLVVNQTGSAVKPGQQTLQSQAEELFLRDWGSEYASTLPVKDVDVCPRH